MADLKPAYLVHGDDDAKIDAWRGRLRRRAEEEGGAGALESFHASTAAPGAVAGALMALTFATGTRYLMADGVEAWKAGDLEPLESGLADMPPDTVLLLIARGKALARLVKAVEKAGGEVREFAAPKPWEMPRWVTARASESGLRLDSEAAKALVAAVGAGQQRLAREIEKLTIAAYPQSQLNADEVDRFVGADTAPKVYDLADALVAGDVQRTLALAEDLGRTGERPGSLMYPVVRRLREVHRASELLAQGTPEGDIAKQMKLPPWLAKRTVARAKKAHRDGLERAICTFADLEVELRGGGDLGLDEDTAFSRALARAAAG
ncbi:MAG: DNA polymerase III subunit delta [Thermoleophilaceae bacterium]